MTIIAETAQQGSRARIMIHAPQAVERLAVQAILSRQPRFDLSFGSRLPGNATQQLQPPALLVWVGCGLSLQPLAGPPRPWPRTLVVLREINAIAAVSSLRSGAAGLTCLGCHLDELPQAVDAIAAGQGWLAPCLAKGVADHLAGRARMRESDSCGLTARELRVLQSIAAGADNIEVADDLGIDVRTVKFHASNIYRKLGARHRAEAVALAYRLGLTA
jgi:DNA-binding NarL/FixJ family response regulator